MTIPQLEAAIEAILFTMGEPVDTMSIAKAIEQDKETTRKLIDGLRIRYEKENRGIRLLELEDSWQLCTKKEYYNVLIQLASQPKKAVLTDVMLETLSIIAYKQPITKSEIEKIRGVKSDHAVNRLVEYNLVTELGRLDAPGRPILFGTTQEFLRKFGVSAISELPEVSTVKMEDFKAEAEAEIFKDEKPENEGKEEVQGDGLQIEFPEEILNAEEMQPEKEQVSGETESAFEEKAESVENEREAQSENAVEENEMFSEIEAEAVGSESEAHSQSISEEDEV